MHPSTLFELTLREHHRLLAEGALARDQARALRHRLLTEPSRRRPDHATRNGSLGHPEPGVRGTAR